MLIVLMIFAKRSASSPSTLASSSLLLPITSTPEFSSVSATAGVRMAAYKMWFNPAKAIKELGLPQTEPRQALLDAVNWFRAHGYVR